MVYVYNRFQDRRLLGVAPVVFTIVAALAVLMLFSADKAKAQSTAQSQYCYPPQIPDTKPALQNLYDGNQGSIKGQYCTEPPPANPEPTKEVPPGETPAPIKDFDTAAGKSAKESMVSADQVKEEPLPTEQNPEDASANSDNSEIASSSLLSDPAANAATRSHDQPPSPSQTNSSFSTDNDRPATDTAPSNHETTAKDPSASGSPAQTRPNADTPTNQHTEDPASSVDDEPVDTDGGHQSKADGADSEAVPEESNDSAPTNDSAPAEDSSADTDTDNSPDSDSDEKASVSEQDKASNSNTEIAASTNTATSAQGDGPQDSSGSASTDDDQSRNVADQNKDANPKTSEKVTELPETSGLPLLQNPLEAALVAILAVTSLAAAARLLWVTLHR